METETEKPAGVPPAKKQHHPPKGALSNFRVASTSLLMKKNSDRDPGWSAPDGRGRSGMFSLTRQSGVGRAFARHTEQTQPGLSNLTPGPQLAWLLSDSRMWAGRACLAEEMSRMARPTLNPGQALGGGQMPSAPRSPGQGPDLPSGMPVPWGSSQRGALAGSTNSLSFLWPTCGMSGISPDEPAVERARTMPARARHPGSVHGGRSEAERHKAVMDRSGQCLLSFLQCEKSQLGPFLQAAWSHILPEMLHACVHV